MKMDRQPFNLVLTDLSLPDVDGKWLVQKIRRQHPGTKVIVLAHDAAAENILDAVRSGADDFLSKPFDPEMVIERVNHLLAAARSDRSNFRWRRRTAIHLRRLRNRRRHLAEQVELVCQDLVGGYRRTLEKLLEFQSQQDCRAAIDGRYQIKPLLGTVLRYLSDNFNGASGAVFVCPFSSARARLFTTVGGGPPANIEDYDRTLINGIIQQTLQSRVPLLGSYSYDFGPAVADGSDSEQASAQLAPRSLLAAGLYVRQREIGALVLQRRRQDPFTSRDTQRLAHLISPIASSIDLALRLESTTSCQPGSPQGDLL